MPNITINFSNCQLNYTLKSTPVVSNWGRMMAQTTAQQIHPRCRQYNANHGFATSSQINECVSVIQSIAAKYQISFPPVLNEHNWHESLNQAHVSFPDWVARSAQGMDDAHVYNLIIHWLEYEFANKYENRREYLINTDFNHDRPSYQQCTNFVPTDYAEFTPELEFGSIHLHYAHIGRHFLEMANAHDFIAPANHFVPQRKYCATFGMVFSEPGTRDYGKLREYYINRGGHHFFRIDFDDPMLASGFYRLGTLSNVADYATIESRDMLRQQLSQAQIISWTYNE